MAKTHPITEAQKQFLETFRCERLREDPTNRWQIQSFYHPDGEGLVEKIKLLAWEEDHLGKTAYYVIKNASGQIVMVFSLKCGTLFNPNSVSRFSSIYENTDPREVWNAILSPAERYDVEDAGLMDQHLIPTIKAVREDRASPKRINLQKLRRAVGPRRYDQILKNADAYIQVLRERTSEPNQNIILVPESYPAIELVEFCTNYALRDCWDKALMGGRRMGETLFWWFIAPKMLQIADTIGCEYVFLFAANNPRKDAEKAEKEAAQQTEEQRQAAARKEKKKLNSLVSYYHSLHFKNNPYLGTAKPRYDYECQFLCQPLRVSEEFAAEQINEIEGIYEFAGLDARQKQFFWSFNEEAEDPTAFDYT